MYRSEIWGKGLNELFKKKYGKSSRFVLVLISKHYPIKDWTGIEFTRAIIEENKRKKEFVLPVMLDKIKFAGLPSDKAYLDFYEYGAEGIAECLFEKVKKDSASKVSEVFQKAYQEWKLREFLPGEKKIRYILDHISEITFDIDTCEFLLRSISGYHQDLKEKLSTINNNIIFDASQRMIGKEENNYTKYRGINYLVFADPKKAGPYLFNIYKDENEDIKLRAEAFERLWKCDSEQGIDESYYIALKEKNWQLRKAAIKNICYGRLRSETSEILKTALKDGRWKVRVEAAYAIARNSLNNLVPDLVKAIENESSKKGGKEILYCLWNLKGHSSVKDFMEKYKEKLPKWFFRPPENHALSKDMVDDNIY